jgi:hypothetical protein
MLRKAGINVPGIVGGYQAQDGDGPSRGRASIQYGQGGYEGGGQASGALVAALASRQRGVGNLFGEIRKTIDNQILKVSEGLRHFNEAETEALSPAKLRELKDNAGIKLQELRVAREEEDGKLAIPQGELKRAQASEAEAVAAARELHAQDAEGNKAEIDALKTRIVKLRADIGDEENPKVGSLRWKVAQAEVRYKQTTEQLDLDIDQLDKFVARAEEKLAEFDAVQTQTDSRTGTSGTILGEAGKTMDQLDNLLVHDQAVNKAGADNYKKDERVALASAERKIEQGREKRASAALDDELFGAPKAN